MKDLEHESLDEEALVRKVDNQDMIIELLKQKLDETERKLVKSNEALNTKDSEYEKLLDVTKEQEDKIAHLEVVFKVSRFFSSQLVRLKSLEIGRLEVLST